MCNCSPTPANICDQCSNGMSCCCPPDYSIMPQPVPCACCPPGYTFHGATPNWPNGYCADTETGRKQVATVPCNTCAETMSSDCIIIPAISCLGFLGGNLTTFLNYMCSVAYTENFLARIGLNPTLGSGFCQLVQNCPPAGGGTTPIILSFTITFP